MVSAGSLIVLVQEYHIMASYSNLNTMKDLYNVAKVVIFDISMHY